MANVPIETLRAFCSRVNALQPYAVPGETYPIKANANLHEETDGGYHVVLKFFRREDTGYRDVAAVQTPGWWDVGNENLRDLLAAPFPETDPEDAAYTVKMMTPLVEAGLVRQAEPSIWHGRRGAFGTLRSVPYGDHEQERWQIVA